MYPHHQRAIDSLLSYLQDDTHILAVILGGSVAKGCARPDSDIDAIVAVTDERYGQLAASNLTAQSIYGHCDYEGGYFDLKYCTKGFLEAAASHGSEPARNAFVKARCIKCVDEEIAALVPTIGVFQTSEREAKQKSFYAAILLNKGYFWQM